MGCNCSEFFCDCGITNYRKPMYSAIQRGNTWNVMEQDASIDYYRNILVNLSEWQARSIAAIMNGGN